MCHCADQADNPASTDVDAVRAALNQILNGEQRHLASPRVMSEVERTYESLTRAGLSLNDPAFLLPVYSDLGELATAVEVRRPQDVHFRALTLAARFLRIAETALEDQQHEDRNVGCSDEPPF